MSDTDKEPTTTAPQGRAPSGSPLVIVLVAVIAVLAVVVAYLVWERDDSPAESGASPATSAPASESASPEPTSAPAVTDPKALELIRSLPKRDSSDAQAKGRTDATVVMVLYSDFACPYCTLLAQQVEPQLADLVEDGTLRIEWRDLAQISETSPLAAQAGLAAAEQGRFWEFHDAVYAAADPSDHPTYTTDSLVEFAKTAGVPDIDQFTATMNDAHTAEKVTKAADDAHGMGISSTPFMIIGNAVIPGYRDAAFVRQTVIDQAAESAQ
ncbi:DSBA-like thioredoxin domain protein [Schaalia georgiae F0490]|uniref:DSBA-like thioredoxin domain protein n=1 Tax=Schaalia georgiae F0490 TaxID=1125717 RepID=J1HMX8_9ACTO|nr:thioredoxin domain-containing protein [Schaalia georgiae]EJF47345.1 DSBA-like thioredoxin domain protein [Schaalia georgiae F0490]